MNFLNNFMAKAKATTTKAAQTIENAAKSINTDKIKWIAIEKIVIDPELKGIFKQEEKEIVALENANFELSSEIREIGDYKDGWITNGVFYTMNGWCAKPENWKDKSKLWPETNFEKIFKKKKPGDTFPFRVRIIYRFDNEEEKTTRHRFHSNNF